MKMTFQVPDDIGQEFRRAIPAGERSRLIAQFMQQQARRRQSRVKQACLRANRLAKLGGEMKKWGQIHDSGL
jgi:hypothetical protein